MIGEGSSAGRPLPGSKQNLSSILKVCTSNHNTGVIKFKKPEALKKKCGHEENMDYA
jgi:hypothetical protein